MWYFQSLNSGDAGGSSSRKREEPGQVGDAGSGVACCPRSSSPQRRWLQQRHSVRAEVRSFPTFARFGLLLRPRVFSHARRRRLHNLPTAPKRMWLLAVTTTFWGLLLAPGFALQIQCYQCEEFQLNNDCSAPEFIVNCTVNVQDMCQKEVMEKSSGILYRKSCASSAACLMTSAGYQTFCTPGKINSVCISCCNTPLCNGPRPKKRGNAGIMPRAGVLTTVLLSSLPFLSSAHC